MLKRVLFSILTVLLVTMFCLPAKAQTNQSEDLLRQATTLAKEKRYQEAHGLATRIIQADSNFTRAYSFRAVMRGMLRDKPGAYQDLIKAASLYQSQGDTYKANVMLESARRVLKDQKTK